MMGGQGSGWHGDSQEHSEVAQGNSGNQNASENATEEGRKKGGEHSHGGGQSE